MGGPSSSSLGGTLVFDKSVDEYIRKIQKQLPTISEDGSSPVTRKGKKKLGFLVDIEGIADQTNEAGNSAFDELPSIATLAQPGNFAVDEDQQPGNQGRKKDEKRDPNSSFSSLIMKSIKGMRTPKPQKKGTVTGDEEKYFPDAVKEDASKRFSANSCLLNAGGDGESWDAD
jgi:hypothetical protein